VNRHLISTADLSREDAVAILDTAEEFARLAERPIPKLPTLRGRTVVNLFYEDSTRTRISFEAAAKRLSADVINFSAKGSSVAKGESLKDTALTLQAMGADAVVIRHSSSGAPHRLAGWVRGSVVNAGDGTHEHPTQALLDAFTMRRRLGRLDGLRVTIVGDILHSRVARSNVWLLRTLGAQVTLVAPPTLLPVAVGTWPCSVSYDLSGELAASDVVMMLRVQHERMNDAFFPSVREYSRRYGLDADRMALLPEHAIVMHPGPMNRGVEIAADVADSARSTIVEQVTNGVLVRMAVLYLMLSGSREPEDTLRAGTGGAVGIPVGNGPETGTDTDAHDVRGANGGHDGHGGDHGNGGRGGNEGRGGDGRHGSHDAPTLAGARHTAARPAGGAR
jgi:aspartate carbamoyltransferase catalytic subunit